MKEWFKRHGEMVAAIASGILLLMGFLLEGHISTLLNTLIYLSAFIVGGYVKAKEGLISLFKDKELDVNLLMIFAAVGAASIGYWLEGAMLIFIFSMSGALESYTMAKSERDLSKLMSLKPDVARRLNKDGSEEEVEIQELGLGDLVIVRPGERIPVDGIVTEGSSLVNQATITGEPIPVEKSLEDEVFAGTQNGSGALVIRVNQTSENTVFAKILRLIEQAKEQVPEKQQRIERFERIYSQIVLSVTGFMLFLPHFIFGWSWDETLYRAMVFLVVASPCAVVASVMPALLSAMSSGARKGILFKNGVQLEKLADIQVFAFDKTGTLTKGEPKVTDWLPMGEMTEEDLIKITASIEQLSEHPLARAMVEEAKVRNYSLERPDQLRAVTGFGVEAEMNGETWKIGKPGFFNEFSEEIQHVVEQKEKEGKTVVVVGKNEKALAVVALQDTIRPEAKQMIADLRNQGIRVAMLTGDQEETARAIAKEAGIDLFYSNLLPDEKVKKIEELQKTYGFVAMTGDGVNDAPALATAHVGIAMGGAGSDIALETADVVLMKDDLSKVGVAIGLGRKLRVIVKQNMVFALGVIGMLLMANFFQSISLPFGVIGHEGSTILVILNGLRLLK